MFLCQRPSFVMFGQALGRRSFLLCHALVKSRIFLFYPMSCLPRVARPPFGVMLWQAPDFSFLSDVMPAHVVRPPFGVMLWQKRGNYTPSIVIARLGKADYLKSLRHSPPRHCEAWKSRSNPV